ncbi:hypothetical protein GCM10009111_00070 [Colwellia asteriadis]|uniref:PEP-CTERM sorting domain-containing protein n=1 Tax=Colwellia asteriadis TaxID=517723 RepID=A0ABN1L1X7_9GAMM
MKYVSQALLFFMLILLSNISKATTMCSTSDVTLTDVQLVPEVQVDPFPNPPSTTIPTTNSSDCVGLLSGNDKPYPSGGGSHNIGEYGDGLLNGAVQTGGNTDDSLAPFNKLFDPFYNESDPLDPFELDGSEGYNPDLAFILPSDLQDLDGANDGNSYKTDPGWVYLGKEEGEGFDYATAGKGLLGETNVGSVVDISFSCAVGSIGGECVSGAWSVMPDYNIANTLFDLFGDGVFDHLALVFKTGNVCEKEEGEKGKPDCEKGSNFAIYDFNFNILLGGGLDLSMPYNLGGAFDLDTAFGGKGISHISVWARDPAFSKEIPEPKSTMLLIIAFILLTLRHRAQRK